MLYLIILSVFWFGVGWLAATYAWTRVKNRVQFIEPKEYVKGKTRTIEEPTESAMFVEPETPKQKFDRAETVSDLIIKE